MTQSSSRTFDVAGRQLLCQMCGNERFHEKEARLSTSVAFGPDWAGTKATCRVCSRCGFVHWFLPVHGHDADTGAIAMEDHGMSELAEEIEALRRSLDELYDQPAEELDEALTR